MPGRNLRYILLLITAAATLCGRVAADDHPLSNERRAAISRQWKQALSQQTQELVRIYSQRGDAQFFLGNFAQAVLEYRMMIELNPGLETSHWRLGIACFYAGHYKQAAHQFEIYHTFDDVDRENGIWRYLSQAKAYSIPKAREGLLVYKKDDRQPFPDVYKLFAGDTTPQAILQTINAAKISDDERAKRLFYAQLYIGLNHFVEQRPGPAREHLRQAVANSWGQAAEGGPKYMWHVGRVHYNLLSQTETHQEKKKK